MVHSQRFVGIDVSKDRLDVAILPEKEHWNVPNDTPGRKKLIKQLAKLTPTLILLEPSGGYEIEVIAALFDAELPVVSQNPRQVRNFAKACGKLAKTDKIDALVLAEMARAIEPQRRPPKPKELREFSGLVKRRTDLLENITVETNRKRMETNAFARADIEAHIKYLRQRVKAIEAMIRQYIKENEEWKEKDRIVRSFKGAGPVLSSVQIAHLPELGALSRKEIAALVGVAPFNCDSGQFCGRRRVWGGRVQVRNVLYMAALCAIKCNSTIKTFYERLKENGKPFKVAMTACMRKIITTLNAMVRDREEWCENHQAAAA